jgi:hypothetical protein
MERRSGSGSGESLKRGKNWKSKSHKDKAEADSFKDSGEVDVSPAGEEEERLQNQTLYVTEGMNLKELMRESFPKSLSESETPFGLIGLHTCGSLGVDSLRLFLGSEESKFICNVPCCYHHLEESVFSPSAPMNDYLFYIPKTRPGVERDVNFWRREEEALTPNPTFPLSHFLQEKQFNLGRNARMMSSYSLHRVSHDLKVRQRKAVIY